MDPQRVAHHQKARLQGAMLEAVARHGYAGTTLRELVSLAGVSKSTFYQHFDNKQECFLSTFDEVIDQLAVRVGDAYRGGGEFRGRLVAGLAAFMNLAVEEPAAASLTAVESLTLGAAALPHSERALRAFEVLIQQSFDSSPSPQTVSPIAVRAIVGGIRGVAYRGLRAGRPQELPGTVDLLAAWVLGFQDPERELTRRAVEGATLPFAAEPEPAAEEGGAVEVPSWDEPPDSKLSRRTLSQRERIVRAAARVVVERGYASLSIPVISAAAGTSNQTFYEHFDSKRDAFLASFEALSQRPLAAATGAFHAAGDRPQAIGAALRAVLEQITADRFFARLAFFELPTAGPVALDRADMILDSFTAMLMPGVAPTALGPPPPEVIRQAISNGIWVVIQNEIAHGRVQALPELAPELTRIALASYNSL